MIKAWWSVTLPSFTLRRFRGVPSSPAAYPAKREYCPAGRHVPAFHRKRPPGYSGFRFGDRTSLSFHTGFALWKASCQPRSSASCSLPLQRGKVVQKRRFLAGFFPLNGFNHKLPGILYPLQGGYGFGLLFPLGGRLGGKIYSPLAVTALSCQNLAGTKFLFSK